MSEAAFGLYSAAGCAPETRLAAGASLDLFAPVQADGVTLFRRSLWLPIPVAARLARALDLVGSSLALRFAPADIEVETGDTVWFSRAETLDNRTVDLEFVWPAPVRRFQPPAGFTGIGMHLHRMDGAQVVDDASQNGSTGGALDPPWVGSVEVRLDAAIVAKLKKGVKHKVGAKAVARAAGGAGSPISETKPGGIEVGILLDRVSQSHVIPAVVLAGVPTSPRAKLFLERPTEAERLLWQGLLPGEQAAAVTLPAKPLPEEWAAALEQVVKAFADDEKKRAEAAQAGTPITSASQGAMLRLDLESDTPCALTLQQATLALLARFELAPNPARVDFDGSQARSTPIVFGPLPAGTAQALTLSGRVEGGDGPAPSAGGAQARRGILLGPEQALVLRQSLPAPIALAGLGLLWHPLSEALKGRLAILADGGAGPGRTLLEQRFELATPAPGWLALRWPALDLQAQDLWLKLVVEEGLGLWLAPGEDAPPPGWLESYGAGKAPLALAPACQWVDPTDPAQLAAGGLRFHLGSQPLEATRKDDKLTLTVPTSALATLGTTPLQATSATLGRFTVESVELSVAL
jgi:hypothetical protein